MNLMRNNFTQENMAAYINDKKTAFKELGIMRYCSKEEISELYSARSTGEADRIGYRILDKYYDKMLADYEKNEINCDSTENEITKLALPNKTKNLLISYMFETLEEFEEYCAECGWHTLNYIGVKTATEIFSYMYPSMKQEDVDALVKQYK